MEKAKIRGDGKMQHKRKVSRRHGWKIASKIYENMIADVQLKVSIIGNQQDLE